MDPEVETDYGYRDRVAGLGGAMMAEKSIRRPSKLEQLNHMKTQLERKLAEINEAIAALEANPAMADLIHKLEKVL